MARNGFRLFVFLPSEPSIDRSLAPFYAVIIYLAKCLNKKGHGTLNEAFKALADPTRRHILQILRDRSMTAGEIADHFNISKPSISHHLNLLKQAGLVLDERQGQSIIYSLHTTVVEDVIGWMFGIIDKQEKRD